MDIRNGYFRGRQRYLYLHQYKYTSKKNHVWLAELDECGIKPGIQWRKVINEYVADYSIITNHGPLLYVKTNLDAPQHKVVTVHLSKEEIEIRDFIPEVKNAKLVQVNCVNKMYFVAIYKCDMKYTYSEMRSACSSGTGHCWHQIRSEQRDATSFLAHTPSTIARYDFTSPHRFSHPPVNEGQQTEPR
ncbi:hypothetical protein PILCRDRAFT_827771 [Piloderma croceum F 1598]|uniref:Peptidase S9A N-terminal domain-containing protein n=1 Tax=Piloderma croceum (strain F 1598) TaxID=765440 RepID=A0A0C3F4W6_PILCF|nr:hypothetical protein PILCRDRAFT_827771 [Piloderma croceum F 1598]